MKLHIAVRTLLILILCCAGASAQQLQAKLERVFTTPRYALNGNALVAERGKIIYENSFGFADAESKRLNNEHSSFQLGSITKVFTSTAVLQLKEKGMLRLDDRFAKYFPEFPYPEITIRQLLSHTSGLPDFQIFEELVSQSPASVFTNADIIPALKLWKKGLESKPGDRWSYSNPGYALLALLVEKLAASKLNVYVRQHIVVPAAMTDTYFETDDEALSDVNKAREQRYQFLFDTKLKPAKQDTWRGFYGNGGIITTARDLLKFDEALYSGKLLSQSTLGEAFEPAKLNSGQKAKTDTLASSYGLGWFVINDDPSSKIVWHGGGRQGVVTVFFRNISKGQTVIVFDNSFNRETYRLGLTALNLLNGKPSVMRKSSLAREYARTLVENGSDAAHAKLVELKFDKENYYLDEDEMNDLALQLLYAGTFPNSKQMALEVARLNVAFFPESFNIYDTYGEILAATGKTDIAIAMYQRSILMNPKNEGGKRALDKLMKNR